LFLSVLPYHNPIFFKELYEGLVQTVLAIMPFSLAFQLWWMNEEHSRLIHHGGNLYLTSSKDAELEIPVAFYLVPHTTQSWNITAATFSNMAV